MLQVRRVIGRTAVCWLLCQTVALAIVPPLVWAAAGDGLECTCGHGDHAMCPMHHRPKGTPRCAMRAVPDFAMQALGTLFSTVAPIRSDRSTPVYVPTIAAVPSIVASLVLRSIPPDLPPPRA